MARPWWYWGNSSSLYFPRLQKQKQRASRASDECQSDGCTGLWASIYLTIFNSTLPSLLTHIGRDVGNTGIIHVRKGFLKSVSRGTLIGTVMDWVFRVWSWRGIEWKRGVAVTLHGPVVNIKPVKENVLYTSIFGHLTRSCVKLSSNTPRM